MRFMSLYKELVVKLKEENKTIATMESCTGGAVANEITNIEGASDVFKFGAVTYSTEAKIQMGVSKSVIDEFSVYSSQVAREMSRAICEYANSDYGVGITGHFDNNYDENGKLPSLVYISVYKKDEDKYLINTVDAIYNLRKDNKKLICDVVVHMIKSMGR